MLRGLVLVVRFACKPAALAALAAWGYHSSEGPLRYGLALLAPAAAATLWGLRIAPKARRRARDPLRLLLELLVFGAACAALFAMGQRTLAATLAVSSLATALAVRRWPEP